VFRKILAGVYERAHQAHLDKMVELIRRVPLPDPYVNGAVDLGTGDGLLADRLEDHLGFRNCFLNRYDKHPRPQTKNENVTECDFEVGIPLEDDSVDLVHANDVLEHVANVDVFAKEVKRILKPGCWALIGTENGSSWCNVFASAMGWQPFSTACMSRVVLSLGNPLSIHRWREYDGAQPVPHRMIFHYRGLKEFWEAHGFEVWRIIGTGYFPLPWKLGRWDPRHAHMLVAVIRKPKEKDDAPTC